MTTEKILTRVLFVIAILLAVFIIARRCQSQEYFKHPGYGQCDPYAGLGCCARRHCMPVPYSGGRIQLEDGEWIDPREHPFSEKHWSSELGCNGVYSNMAHVCINDNGALVCTFTPPAEVASSKEKIIYAGR